MRKRSRRLKFRIIDSHVGDSEPKPTLVDLSVSQIRRMSGRFDSTGKRIILIFGIILLVMLVLTIACDKLFGN